MENRTKTTSMQLEQQLWLEVPMYLKEDSSEIFKTCKDEIEFYEATIALVADVDEEEVPGGILFSPRQVFIVLEDQVVMTHHSWTDALLCFYLG